MVRRPPSRCGAALARRALSSHKQGGGVLLPKTGFPMRANAAVRELEAVDATTTKLYRWQRQREGPAFCLHDGPPYANGALHTGHFLNKTLKDMTNRFRLLTGCRVHYVPGWDCHGLPIELKALGALKKGQTRDSLSIAELRALAKSCAIEAIEGQAEGFKRWGVMADWDDPARGAYRTLDPAYEASQLRVFEGMAERGFVQRGRKPVYWSYSSGTALAEAEIEYADDHESPSCMVDFVLAPCATSDPAGAPRAPLLVELAGAGRLRATIWTTTPWTLLSNVAISVHAETEYYLVAGAGEEGEGPVRLVARDCLERDSELAAALGAGPEPRVLGRVKGSDLEGLEYRHPLEPENTTNVYRVLCGKHVTTDSGTGLVHTAPTHGQDDFVVWRASGGALDDCPCPVDDSGRFFRESPASGARCRVGTEDVWDALEGLHIHKGGNDKVLELLGQAGALPCPPTTIRHRYPYDWRTKAPVITRATEQWFVNLSTLKADAARALEEVELVPAASRHRLSSMLEGREEWCISRQRVWGVPIPALFAEDPAAGPGAPRVAWMDAFLVRAAREQVALHGSDWWFCAPDVEEVVSTRANAMRVEAGLDAVHAPAGAAWTRGSDTLDVWFDSGSSWRAVLGGPHDAGDVADTAAIRADVYLEGSDQHRGWFQSSLLTKVASTSGPGTAARAPFGTIVTHGFLLDEEEMKMSKSAGNVIVPDDVINGKGSFNREPAYGVDVMRLWVASTDFTRDVKLGKGSIREVSDAVRKLRNVTRFLLGNLRGFEPAPTREAAHAQLAALPLTALDRLMLDRAHRLAETSRSAYESFRFRSVYSELTRFVSNDLSALYATSAKDRLYCEREDDPSRRASQAVLWELLQTVTLVAAPILCYTAEEIARFAAAEVAPFPSDAAGAAPFSVFQSRFPEPPQEWRLTEPEAALWDRRLQIRQAVNRVLEDLRRAGEIASTEEAELELEVFAPSDALLAEGEGAILANLMLVSQCSLTEPGVGQGRGSGALAEETLEGLGLRLVVRRASKGLCPRCRRHAAPAPSAEGTLCERCAGVVAKQ